MGAGIKEPFMRYIAFIVLTSLAMVGATFCVGVRGVAAAPVFRVCSAIEPDSADKEIDKLAGSQALTTQMFSMRAADVQQRAVIDSLRLHVQQAIFSQYRWPVGSTVAIAFMSGDPIVQQRIQNSAMIW